MDHEVYADPEDRLSLTLRFGLTSPLVDDGADEDGAQPAAGKQAGERTAAS